MVIGPPALLLIVLVAHLRTSVRSSMYPPPPPMPPTMELLARLEAVLRTNCPNLLRTLQPGLTDEQIARIEATSRVVLAPELRVLYGWRNGTPRAANMTVTTLHEFVPLDDAIARRAAVRQGVQQEGIVTRALHDAFAGHRDGWLDVFVDLAGDGYFYDPARRDQPGSFFYCFNETGDYLYFPSLNNFLAGLIECYESGVYVVSPPSDELEADFDREEAVWAKYGARRAEASE
jgi:cell wall assembly regulator SMI1